jgi:lipopolysaccharide export system protein LptA
MKPLFLSLFLLFSLLSSVIAAPVSERSSTLSALGKESLPIKIVSDRLEADDMARKVKFIGHVIVRRGDVTLYAHEVLVTYLQGKGDIEEIMASGEVRIIQNDRIATGERATLYQKEGKIVLTGSARLLQGKDSIEGEEITVLINEEKSIIKAQQGGRVQAIFHPNESGGAR